MSKVAGLLAENINLLKSETSKAAYQGVVIAIGAIFVATLMVSYISTGTISIAGFQAAQVSNPALWVIDLMPFVFGFWGQYSSTIIAYKAGAMVVDQTQDLRMQTGSLEKQHAFISTHDQLTNLPNRNQFYEQVNKVIFSGRGNASDNPKFSVVVLEIENYGDIYDTLGRSSGDIIIKQVAERLLALGRSRDQIAKIDSNVFGVMIHDEKGISRAEEYVREAQKAMESPFLINSFYVGINFLAGIARYPDHGEHVDGLVQRAGNALHLAQHSSKGYAFFESSKEAHSPMRLSLISDLRHAIVKGGLELFYQPQIAIKSGQVIGVEALLRWKHPEYGHIPPDDLIPMAERNRIFQLTQWVLRRAFHDCTEWQKQGYAFTVSVNLSAKDLLNPDLPEFISSAAVVSGAKPEWVMFEIKESALMSEPENAMAMIKKLYDLGYQFAIDNYGTGYTSLAYLVNLPISGLKLSKAYVAEVLTKDSMGVIVNATVNLAHNLGFTITANGVESREVLNKLQAYGCDAAQGYYLGNPMPLAEFTRWIEDTNWKISKI